MAVCGHRTRSCVSDEKVARQMHLPRHGKIACLVDRRSAGAPAPAPQAGRCRPRGKRQTWASASSLSLRVPGKGRTEWPARQCNSGCRVLIYAEAMHPKRQNLSSTTYSPPPAPLVCNAKWRPRACHRVLQGDPNEIAYPGARDRRRRRRLFGALPPDQAGLVGRDADRAVGPDLAAPPGTRRAASTP